jgi:hypothetical protein
MVSTIIMGATTRMSRRRCSSVDKDGGMINNDNSINSNNNNNNNNNNAISNTNTNINNSNISNNDISNNNNNYHTNYNSRIRRRSDMHYQSLKVHFRSSNDGEDESSHSSAECDNDNDNDIEEIDSYSSSSQSVDENTTFLPLHPLPPPPPPPPRTIPETKIIGDRRSNSDTYLYSSSNHRKALHESESSESISRILKSDIEYQQQHRQQHQHQHNNIQIIRDGHRRSRSGAYMSGIPSTSSHSLPSHSLPSHYEIENDDDSNNSNDISSNAFSNGIHITYKTTTPQQQRLLWRSLLKVKNPLFLLLVTGVSLLGVGLYTQSYATLSIAIDQVTVITEERNKKVSVHFDSIERDIHILQGQLLEIDPGAVLITSSSSNTDSNTDSGASSTTTSTKTNTNDKVSSSSFDDDDDDDESGMFDEMVAMQEKLRISNSEMSSLQKYVQMTSLRDATRKYGTGVIRVQLELDFPEDRENKNKSNKGTTTITSSSGDEATLVEGGEQSDVSAKSSNNNNILILEMASLELMPHSVFTFLEMIHSKLFDGCSFILNAMHVVKAAPLPYDGSSASQKVKAFTKLGLDTVSFREYSSEYPHKQYTVGFAADGSPSFYINTKDNTEQHIGEPCFAKIISGFETVERLKAAPTRNGIWYRKRIGLKRAVIL